MRTSVLAIIVVVIGICFQKADAISKQKDSNSLLQIIKDVIKEGYSAAGIPVLDPYRLDRIHVDFEDNIFRISSNITDITFAGLGDFEVRKFGFVVEELTYIIDFDIYFPSLNFTSDYYEMEGNIIEAFPLAGKGVAHVEIYGLNIWSKLYLKLTNNGGSIMGDRFEDGGFSVSQILSKTEYDQNIDDIANAMVEDLLAGYLNRFNKYLAFTYSPLIIDTLNAALFENSQQESAV